MASSAGTKRKHSGDEAGLEATDRRTSTSAPKTAAASGQAGKRRHSRAPDEQIDGCARAGVQDEQRASDDYFRRLYTTELDFRAIGAEDHDFRDVLEGDSHLDFSKPTSVMQLTKTLLRLDFGLLIDLPNDRLCPPVPNRHNYVLWMKDLINSSSASSGLGCDRDEHEHEHRVTGLDIGTGASAIYPLLGCAQRPSWSFIATDIDAESLAYARKNVAFNHYQSRIRVVDRVVTDPLVPLDALGIERIDFVMTNPPFYTSDSELQDLAKQKARPPNSACSGAPVEMVCEGGEVGFVQRIMDESMVLGERVRWYTSMLGKRSSLETLVGMLHKRGILNYAVTTFVQGNKTRRWALGWSFGNRRPSLIASRGFEQPAAGKKVLPYPTEMVIVKEPLHSVDVKQLEKTVCGALKALDLVAWNWDEQRSEGTGFADGNVWSRAHRRKKAREQTPVARGGTVVSAETQQQDVRKCAFGFAISIRTENGAGNDVSESVVVMLWWLQGNDAKLFESFAGVVRNSVRVCAPEGSS
ncbi:Uu.00g049480.m01.CDS01 [Anthostomella pinea]|uniref:Uu.00g049480.m01.CDS01 n=1 Tax=Anthostomella pinea TaxID=933095 RepID=A0AAI8YES6_9PEZI|nr:Uu.00g049480.m01.CDS01 [Anthostomella pinea]